MNGLRFQASPDGNEVHLLLSKIEDESSTVEFMRNQFNLTEFRSFFLIENALAKAISLYKAKIVEKPSEAGLVEPINIVVAEKREASISLEVSDNQMICSLIVESAFGTPNPDKNALMNYLTTHGVVKGINESLLDSFCTKLSNVASGVVVNEPVASGKEPSQSRQAKLELLVVPVQDRLMKPQLRDDGTVDMHDFGEIEMVDVGDPLVRRIPPVVGEPGYTVLGDVVFAPKPQDRLINVGEGTELSEDDNNLLVASRRGVPLKIDNGVLVSDAYCVGDVDLNTGNIEFDGTVVVKGSVKEGMSVKATGKVMVRDYVESATVEAGDDLVIGKGILGRQKNTNENQDDGYSVDIACNGDVYANYIQYARVCASGSITIAKHVMHSDLAAQSIIAISPKKSEGKIIGGLIQPLNSLTCNTLGGPSYIPTRVDFTSRFGTQLSDVNSIYSELSERLNVIRGMKQALNQIENKNVNGEVGEQVEKITNTINHFTQIIAELKQKRAVLIEEIESIKETLEVQVTKALYPGVQVCFVQNDVPIKQERDACRIKAKGDGITFFTLE